MVFVAVFCLQCLNSREITGAIQAVGKSMALNGGGFYSEPSFHYPGIFDGLGVVVGSFTRYVELVILVEPDCALI